MNKRQKKKRYKRLHGYNPPKNAPVQQPSISFDFSGTAEAAREFRRKMDEIIYEIAKAAKAAVMTFLEAAQAYMDDPEFRKMANLAVEENRRASAEAAQMPSGNGQLPCIVTAESLTAQRMAGKRRKKNHKKRRI